MATNSNRGSSNPNSATGNTKRGTWRRKSGQALMELTVGLFALALVVSALCGFAVYIAKSLKMQNSLRIGASSQHDRVQVSDFAARYIFGSQTVPIHEKVVMPATIILK